MALQTTPEEPAAVRTVSRAVAEWVGRLGAIWIDGQVAEYRPRPGARQFYLTLRDPDVEMSITIVADAKVLGAVEPPVAAGQRIIVFAQPEFYTGKGSLQFRAKQIRAVGIGDLLAQLERLRALLAAEGLFAAERKQPLPFLPRKIGLICGRGSAAMHDVTVNASERWPGIEFEIREVAVQGMQCVPEVIGALQELEAVAEVDVIIITRGGGSVEDLLPFSNESLVRAVSDCRTPIVSAIGHEQDAPLLDFVADLRASTPTDAAKRVVPSLVEQESIVNGLRNRARVSVANQFEREATQIRDHRRRMTTVISHIVERSAAQIAHLAAQVRSLSPAATLDRGYAIVLAGDGSIVRDESQVKDEQIVDIRLAKGRFAATRIKETR